MRTIQVKPGVIFKTFQSPILSALKVVMDIWTFNGKTATITSANDGKHLDSSLHYKDLAIDLRTKDLSPELTTKIFNSLTNILGDNYDVVLEADHIHLEWDPK